MKSKKFVLAGLVLLAITGLLALVGCKNDTVPEPTRYTVSFDKGDNSEYTGDLPADITVVSGTELRAEQLEGLADTADYIFEGWYDGENKAEGGTYTVTKDVTLVAKWRDLATVASVTFSPAGGTKFYCDESIAVSLTSEEGATIQYHLGDGSWKDYDAGRKIQVTGDTTITTITAKATKEGLKDSAETTATYTVRKLEGITVTTLPAQTVYSVGQEFDSTGMKVTAHYDNGTTRMVTGTITTDTSTLTESAGVQTVTVSYKEEETPKTTTFTITVFPEEVKVLTELEYTSPNHTGSEWTYVEFGEWPQTIKADSVTVGESEGKQMGMFIYYLGDDGNYYVKHSDKYYKVDPIVWRVLTEDYKDPDGKSTGNALLLAEKILTGGIPYYDVYNVNRTVDGATIRPNNYEHSAVRAWLNGLEYQYKKDANTAQTTEKKYLAAGFLQTAFTQSARELIADTTVDNSAASTTDKIFLLSEEEATNSKYGFGAYNNADSAGIRVTTDYAKATGANQSSTPGYGGWWWLRAPNYDYGLTARDIDLDGHAGNDSFVDSPNGGVVPALSISLPLN